MNAYPIFFRILCIILCLISSSALAQQDPSVAIKSQSQLVSDLLSNDPRLITEAVNEITNRIPPEEYTDDMRNALIKALENLNQYRQSSLVADPDFLQNADHELNLRLLKDGVLPLNDPAAVNAIAGQLDTGASARNAMIEIGPSSVDAIFDMLQHPDNPENMEVVGPTLTLRVMVDYFGIDAFTDDQLRQMKELVISQLNRQSLKGEFNYFNYAVQLGISLKDTELRMLIETIAIDRKIILQRGITDEWAINRIQKDARDGLAGELIPPQYAPESEEIYFDSR